MASRTITRHTASLWPPVSRSAVTRPLSTTRTLHIEDLCVEKPITDGSKPRWAYTPAGMKAPFSPHVTKYPQRSVWKVNEDPEVLNTMYTKLLGRDGSRLLPEDLKWLAVTHKSFDQARRGMNDRLSYLGRMAITHECVKTIATSPPKNPAATPDEYGRLPFENPQLASLDNLTFEQPQHIISVQALERVALEVGLAKAMQWKPMNPENMVASGQGTVLVGAIQAIFGAILLQHGSEVASRLIRERILARVKMSS